MNKQIYKPIFNAATVNNDLTLEIYDAIGESLFGGGITASSVSDAINNSGQYDSITLRLNSPGGDLFEGVAIHNVLKTSQKPVNVVVDGLAASAASLIAMAGDSIVMGDGSMMMMHEAMGVCMGFAADMKKESEILETVTASAAELYVTRTGICKRNILEMMKAETWMSAKEAVEKGFATSTSKDIKNVSHSFDLSMLKLFKNTPASLKEVKEVKETEATASVSEPPAFNSLDLRLKQLEVNKRK